MSRMQRFDWARKLCGHIRRPRPASSHRRACYRRLAAEPLEDRRMLATGLFVDQVVPLGDSLHPFDTIEVRFSEAVQDGSFGLDDIYFAVEGGAGPCRR